MSIVINPSPAYLKEVILSAATEATHIFGGMAVVDASLGQCLSDLPPAALAVLQQVDLLRQEVEGLSRFLAHISEEAPQHLQCALDPVLPFLTLQAQALRLVGPFMTAEQTSSRGFCPEEEWTTNDALASEVRVRHRQSR
ncbi:MAG: hypothetical protein FJX25_06590 [Alphaproteobacteria bacterium]|nr:hypothetical protein [Alphaproteobacteria bacterium]